jgi:hypothetical protein
MKDLFSKRNVGLLIKTIPIVLMVQFCIFISVHKAEGHQSASYESHRQDVIVSQHSFTSRFVLSPVNTLHLAGIVSIPYNFTLLKIKSSYLKLMLHPFHKGEAGLLLSTINAP